MHAWHAMHVWHAYHASYNQAIISQATNFKMTLWFEDPSDRNILTNLDTPNTMKATRGAEMSATFHDILHTCMAGSHMGMYLDYLGI